MTNETSNSDEVELAHTDVVEQTDNSKSTPDDRASAGPFDISEVPTIRPYVDFGGIKVAPREGLQLRLEVEERTKRVVAVTLEYDGSVMQLQAFSAPKSTGLWHRVRGELAAQFVSQNAQVSEQDGVLGPELVVVTQATAEQGGAQRMLRFMAVDGPRWMLRGVIMGKAADNSEARQQLVSLFRETVVVRGDQPMPPSELLALQVPAGVVQAPGSAQNTGQEVRPT